MISRGVITARSARLPAAISVITAGSIIVYVVNARTAMSSRRRHAAVVISSEETADSRIVGVPYLVVDCVPIWKAKGVIDKQGSQQPVCY